MGNSRRSRRGSYAALFSASSVLFIGFAALAVDMAIIRLADAEVQATADAAAQAALIRLRATTDRTHSQSIAEQLVNSNRVVGTTPTLQTVEFGIFDDGAFAATQTRANAVRISVSADARMAFAPFWGRNSARVRADATVSTRTLHTIVVLDITNSWTQSDFENARDGALAVYDRLTGTAGPDDRIGLVVFTGQFGTEFTPLLTIQEAIDTNVRDAWANLRTASKAGEPAPGTTRGCTVHGGSKVNDFTDPDGGCFPQMPREYRDEYGTDHAVGIEMATTMFGEFNDPSVYRAMLILTDGEPNGTGPHAQRFADGYNEDRWRSTFVGSRRGRDEVVAESVAWAEAGWSGTEIHTWSVSYKANATWMNDVCQGDGAYIRATNSADLEPIFLDIAESLPMTLVE